MPTYLYHCRDCREDFEEFQSITDKPIEVCPRCGGKAERIITGGVGFLLKGSGFYATDYRSDQYKKDAAADKTSVPSPTSQKKTAKTAKASTKRGDGKQWRTQGR
ncbi:MAG: zinc ribbon domain-containing protein [candidate division Zixibacteria bacterium]|nr:zinc ribbon domain-containing protein [candidate division Zixibacteria bacterium]